MWMRGYNVLHPMGWDAFGLPAEITPSRTMPFPREWTLGQHLRHKAAEILQLALGYDWATEVATCLPEYLPAGIRGSLFTCPKEASLYRSRARGTGALGAPPYGQ